MIETDKGIIRIEGSGADILADYSVITLQLKKILVENGFTEEEAKKQLQENFDIAFEDTETLKEKCIVKMKSELEELLKLLKGVTNHE